MNLSALALIITLALLQTGSSRKITVSLDHHENFISAPDDRTEHERVKRETAAEWGRSSSWNKPTWEDNWEDGDVKAETDDNEETQSKTWTQVRN